MGSQLTPVRHDRDDFIRVNEENILPKMKNNFVKRPYGDAGFHTAGSVDPEHTPYDLLSVIELSKEGAYQAVQKIFYWDIIRKPLNTHGSAMVMFSVLCRNFFKFKKKRSAQPNDFFHSKSSVL